MLRGLLFNQSNLEKTALIDSDRHISYGELIKKALNLCDGLPKTKPENIAIILPNGGEFITAFWAVIGSGNTAFPLNELLKSDEIISLLKHVNVKNLITSISKREFFEKSTEFRALNLKIIYIEELSLSCKTRNYKPKNIKSNKTAVLLNTSGTTGTYKIVQLTERNIEVSLYGYLDKLSLNAWEEKNAKFFLVVPFCSVYGIMILSACLLKSLPIVLLSNNFTIENLYKTTQLHKVTHFEGSSSILLLMEQLLDRKVTYDISTLRYFGFGGTKIYKSTIENIRNAYGNVQFYQGYGMTETSPLVTKHSRGNVEKTDSVGTAINGVEIFIQGDEGLSTVPFLTGEVIVKGGNVMKGYLKNKKSTASAVKNGCFYTGDIGYLDEQGYLYICGRKKNMISVGGFKVYPEEVEECIQSSNMVVECLVYGRIDIKGIETVCVDIVAKDETVTKEKIWELCREKLAGYKIPKVVNFCGAIKKNIANKADRTKRFL